ncbi:MAG: phage holin family protein [Burkholderiales bacterium]
MSEQTGAADGARQAPGGLLHSLRSIGPSLLALLRTRLELLGIEVAEERARVVELTLLALAAAFCVALALLMLNVLVLAWFWDSHRVAAILALIVIYAIAGLVCIVRLKMQLAARRPLFEATMTELKSDLEALARARQD